MTVQDGRIAEATEDELFALYLAREWDEVVSFPDFLRACREKGIVIVDEEDGA